MKINEHNHLMQTVRAAETFNTPKNLFLQCLIMLVVFMALQMAEGFGMVIGAMPRLMDWAREQIVSGGELDRQEMTEKIYSMMADPEMMYIMLFCTGLGTLVVLFFCRIIEGRKFRTMGFFKEKAGLQYLSGLVIGFVMFSCVVGLAYLFGGLKFEGKQEFSVMIFVALLGYGIQGMSEEVMCRGYFMTSVLRRHNLWWAVGLNALFFGLMHASNSGFSLFALFNLMLYAVMISLYMLRTSSLWGACAIHSIWNFAQGNFYGLPVSGLNSGASVFSMSLTGSDWINGGEFGLEAGIPTSVVMIISICILLFVPLPFLDKKTEETA